MGTVKVAEITDLAGTGAPDFPNGLTQGGGEPVAGGPTYVQISGSATLAHNTVNVVDENTTAILTLPDITSGDLGKTIRVLRFGGSNQIDLSANDEFQEMPTYDNAGGDASGPFISSLDVEYLAADPSGGGSYLWLVSGKAQGGD